LLRPLLRLLLQKPELAQRLPIEMLPANSAEARAVKNLCETILASGDATPGYAALLERLRGNEDESILREAAAELMQQPFDEGDIDAEFDGAVVRLAEGESKRAFAVLQEKVSKLGVAGLSGEEKQHYLQALSARGRSG
jgi:DNA primase